MQDVLSVVLGGGRGAGLYPLTKRRSEPAVPLAGKYRLIDIPISNCINSGCNRIYVVTQFLSVSLHRHIAGTYKFDPFSRGFVEVLAAQQTNEVSEWYRGTADALRQNIRRIEMDRGTDVLILYGDQLYRMDFARMIAAHRGAGADVTLAVLPVTAEQAGAFGVACVDAAGRVTRFAEKPGAPELAGLTTPAAWLESQGVAAQGREHLASMGIYVFRREVLLRLLHAAPHSNDLATEIMQGNLDTHQVRAHVFDAFWADLGTIQRYHTVHLALAGTSPPFDFNTPDGVIYTRMRYLPASRISAAHIRGCLVSDGCHIQAGAHLERSVLGVRSQIGRNAVLRDTVFLGANHYAGPPSTVPLGIGDDSIVERAIVDKNCRIGRGVRIINAAQVRDAETETYVIRDGIVVIPNGAVIPDGTVI